MSRPAPSLPISPKMFRHFAIITVAITACVAMFADGEGREAVAAQIKERQQKNELLIAEAEKVGKRTVGFDRASAGKGAVAAANDSVEWSDDGPAYGTPMESADVGGDDPSGPAPRGLIGPVMGPASMRGVPPQVRQRMAPGSQARRPSAEDIERITAASRARSGAHD